jgi:hypothetical protein
MNEPKDPAAERIFCAELYNTIDYEQSQRDSLNKAREENRKLKSVISNLKTGLEVIAKGEYDFGEEFTGDEDSYVAQRLLDDLKEAGL